MPGHLLPKAFLILIKSSLLLLLWQGLVQGQVASDQVWQAVETKYTIIRYQSVEDLEGFNNKVDYGPSRWILKRLFSSSGHDDLTDRVKANVDRLFERVQEILDMRKRMDKVTINIYVNRGQLHDVYRELYKRPCPIRAWYAYEYNAIYVNHDDLHVGMLAHEMAHAIIDHYLLVRPPDATAEILARYVDSHLHE